MRANEERPEHPWIWYKSQLNYYEDIGVIMSESLYFPLSSFLFVLLSSVPNIYMNKIFMKL